VTPHCTVCGRSKMAMGGSVCFFPGDIHCHRFALAAARGRIRDLESWQTEILVSQKVGGFDLNGAIAIANAGPAGRRL